jgi:UDP-N-acetylmuramoylalanine--D-glutamate ligase
LRAASPNLRLSRRERRGMIPVTVFAGKKVAIFGLGGSGLASASALLAGGADVIGWDDNAESVVKATSAGIPTADLREVDWSRVAALVLAPGVPLTHPAPHWSAGLAHAAGVEVIGDIELFCRQRRLIAPTAPFVAITGTNGKSTTTALIDHIVRTAGRPSLAGGNIGAPILSHDPLPEGGVYVLELSSYQIDLTHSLDCDVAVLLNITPDHLDRYDGFEGYAASKARLFAMQSKGHAAVIGIGDAPSADIARNLSRSGRSEDLTKIAPGVCMDQSRWPALQGPHNAQNALAAIAACEALGISQAAIDKGLQTFPGLPHRMERVATRNGVLFVNDSKATNPDSTAPALSAYPRVHWIVGGLAKTDSLEACRAGFGHVVKAYTIGDAGEMFAKLLEGEMPVERSGTLEAAVQSAAAQARPGETVLLSPACASFDQFKDYEARGAAFRAAVEALE